MTPIPYRSSLPLWLQRRPHLRALSDISAQAVADQNAEAAAPAEDIVPEGTPAERSVAILIHEGVPSSDYRFFESGCFTWREPPISLTLNHRDIVVGRLDALGRMEADPTGILTVENFEQTVGDTGDWIVGLITHDLSGGPQSEAYRVAQQVQDRFLRGVSIEFGGDDEGNFECDWICQELDSDGFCERFEMRVVHAEIGTVTVTPFQAMAESVIIDTLPEENDGPEMVMPMVAADASARPRPSLSVWAPPAQPPVGFFNVAEFEPGQVVELPDGTRLSTDEFLVEQDANGTLACPVQILDSGLVFGHAAYWGQCHVGFEDICVSPPPSMASYAHFHTGQVRTADAEALPTGVLTFGCDHAARGLSAHAAADHYANSGLAWADVRFTDGVFGPWFCGAVRPDITAEQRRALEGSSLSGDWRRLSGHLEFIACLSVNSPGFGLVREAITADGRRLPEPPKLSTHYRGGLQTSLVASAIVRREPADCGCGSGARNRALERRLAHLEGIALALGHADQAADVITASI